MLKIGVLGAGHLGKIHIKCIKEIPSFKLVGFYDKNEENAAQVESEFHIKKYDSIEELIQAVDVIDIVTPTVSHYDCAVDAIRESKHVFIEKPLCNTIEEAKKLIELTEEANVKVQVGHVERFNPAFLTAREYIDKPMFIETHRLAQFNPRGTDVPVVLDLMIHDIDIVLSVVNSDIKKVSANGVCIVSETPDIANARLEFANGSVANLTASRLSLKNMRKSRFFQPDAYISVDFLEKTSEIIRMKEVEEGKDDPFAMIIEPGEGKTPKQILFENPEIQPSNAIQSELESFYSAIKDNNSPIVSIMDGYKALDVAFKIVEKINY